jgi:hypothetical protein
LGITKERGTVVRDKLIWFRAKKRSGNFCKNDNGLSESEAGKFF